MKKFRSIFYGLGLISAASITYMLINNTPDQASNILNVRNYPFYAAGTGLVDDSKAIQWAVDSALKSGGALKVYIPAGRYRLDSTIQINRFVNAYAHSFIEIYGDDKMHSPGVTYLRPTFKDKPVFAVHMNKGSIIRGLFFDGLYRSPTMSVDSFYRAPLDSYGDTTCRDSRYSPYTAIAIDPYRGTLPPDSGYPGLQHKYKGPDNASGSTGIRIEDCTFKNFTVGTIISPNGKTLNAEIITYENIRVNDCKYAFVGCQAQEKQNRLINWEVWGRVKCVLGFAKYGQGHPGYYWIDAFNIAGQVGQFIHRPSQGFFPLLVNNVFAESLGEIGYWNTSLNDALMNSSFNFYYYKYRKSFPDNHMNGNGVLLQNVSARYYVFPAVPILLKGNIKYFNSEGPNGGKHIKGWRYYYTDPLMDSGYTIKRIAMGYLPLYFDNGEKKVTLTQRFDSVKVNDIVVFYSASNLDFMGMGEVRTVTDSNYTIGYISPGISPDFRYNVGVYKSK